MAKKNSFPPETADETAELKHRLEETQETLDAIRRYMVDAFVVTQANGEQVVTLNDAEFPYRVMVESMNEGAVTLIPDGTIFYCNSRFGEMVQIESEKLIGIPFRDLILPEERDAFDAALREAGRDGIRREFCLQAAEDRCVPVQLSIYQLAAEQVNAISIIATDISERIQTEEKIRSLASEVTKAEQEERQRISQILHDDLQQRLFAIKTQLLMLKVDKGQDRFSSDVQANLDQLERGLSDAISITRRLSIDLSPIILRGEGLAETILWLCSHMKEQHGLQVEFEAEGNFGQLDNQLRVLLFQTIRELLFNVVKHAERSEAKITMEQFADHTSITVSDSGRGFDIRTVLNDPHAAHGLLILQDRLNLLGCRLDMDSKPGEGTRVMIHVPTKEKSA